MSPRWLIPPGALRLKNITMKENKDSNKTENRIIQNIDRGRKYTSFSYKSKRVNAVRRDRNGEMVDISDPGR